jgi:rhodanese-related sulfurtransferase
LIFSAIGFSLNSATPKTSLNESMDVPSLTVQDLQAKLQSGDNLLLLDVREDSEVATCTLPDALHIPVGLIVTRLGELPKDQPIAVYCHHGGRSARITGYLLSQGFDAINVAGGIHAWATRIDPTMATY